jgi:hypothetical protein
MDSFLKVVFGQGRDRYANLEVDIDGHELRQSAMEL